MPGDVSAPASSEFALATAVTPATRHDDRARGFDAHVHDGWDIGGAANGGYVMAIAARAMAVTAGRPPLSLTAHYLAPARAGSCRVDVETVRAGRRLTTMTGRLVQADVEVARLLGTFGRPAPGETMLAPRPPADLPRYQDSTSTRRFAPAASSGFVDRVDLRFRPGDTGFAHGTPTGRAEVAGWFSFADQAPVDELGLLIAADSFFPPLFNLGVTPRWVPTLELTVHVRAVPAPGPLAARFSNDVVSGGLLSEDGELWDVNGVLVAQSRQLALMPRSE